MADLSFPDLFFVRSALGWLELGCPQEAIIELEKLNPKFRKHPDALLVRWQICAAQSQWTEAVGIAEDFCKMAPQVPVGWINWAFALHELKQTERARKVLEPHLAEFPTLPTIPYNLACYASQLGEVLVAIKYLKTAMKVGDAKKIKEMALQDPDLVPVYDQIHQMKV